MISFDPFDADQLADPYPHYQRLRAESPCLYIERLKLYVLSRHADVERAARSPGLFSSTGGVGYDWQPRPMMPMYDPPEHTRLRRLVSTLFTPSAIAQAATRLQAHADALVDAALERGKLEVVEDLAIPLSLGTIIDLLGVPSDRWKDMRLWSQGIVEGLAGGLTAEANARVETRRKEFVRYLRELLAERRATRDPDARDVISRLVSAEDDDRLAENEVVAFCVLLLTAGYETTVNAIANGFLALLTHPEQWRLVREAPESHIAALAEEAVRWDSPVLSFFRNTLQDVEIAGTTIPKGSKVQLLFASANRDERVFSDPDAFRIDRGRTDHLGYGAGVHYCLGAPLARMQLGSVARSFAQKVGRVRRDGECIRTANVLFRGVRVLPCAVQPR